MIFTGEFLIFMPKNMRSSSGVKRVFLKNRKIINK